MEPYRSTTVSKLKNRWSICDVRGPLGANFAIFSLTDFVKNWPNRFRKNASRPRTATQWGQFSHKKASPLRGFVPRNRHAVIVVIVAVIVGLLYTVLCTATVYTVYYKPILQLILVVVQKPILQLILVVAQRLPKRRWELAHSLFLLLPNGCPSVPVGPGSKYQKSKIHWSMPYVGECWVQILRNWH